MIRASPENSLFDYKSRLLICNRNPFAAIKSRSYEFERLFEAEKMEGSGGHSLAPTGCSKPNAPQQSPPGRKVQDSAQPNPRAEGEGANRAEEAEETSGPPRIPAVEERGSRVRLVGDARPGRASSLGAGRTIVPSYSRFFFLLARRLE